MLMLYMSLVETPEEKDKFEAIYYQYRKLMFFCARKILNDNQLAEDAVHDSFIKLTSCIDKIDEVKCNKTKHFVVVVVENTAKDIYRKEKRRKHINWEQMEEDEIAFYQYKTESMTRVEEAILQLPLTYQHVFCLKYICGYTDAEISKILGIKKSTVRKRISRGKQKLAENLRNMGVDIDGKDIDR